MKNYLPIIFVVLSLTACQSGTTKTVTTTTNTAADSSRPQEIITRDSIYQVTIPTDAPVAANRLIIPGKSIGLTSLDEKYEEAGKHLGPASTEDAAMGGKELATWYSKPVVHGTDTVINETEIFFTTNMGGTDEAKRVRHIRITSPFFATSQRIGTGSSQDSVQKYFPGIKKIASYTSPKTNKQVLIYDDSNSGIAFEIDQQHSCVGITVHKPGEEAYEAYNALFGDVSYF